MANTVTYERLESGPGFRHVKVGITVDFVDGPGEQDFAFKRAKEFVDSRIVKVTEPASRDYYNHLAPGAVGIREDESEGPF
jgi:hypothetical protein